MTCRACGAERSRDELLAITETAPAGRRFWVCRPALFPALRWPDGPEATCFRRVTLDRSRHAIGLAS